MHIGEVTHVGYSGSRYDLSPKQIDKLREYLLRVSMFPGTKWLHHGCATGGDYTAHTIGLEYSFKIALHPPVNNDWTDFRCFQEYHYRDREYSYSGRNQRIVLASNVMITTPKTPWRKGGTWNTIGHAERINKPRVIIYPNGDEQIYGLEVD